MFTRRLRICSFQGPPRGSRRGSPAPVSHSSTACDPQGAGPGPVDVLAARSVSVTHPAAGPEGRERSRVHGAVPCGPPKGLPRKEVIQPQLPLRLPCYDFTPVTSPTFDGSLPKGWGTGFGCCSLPWCDGRCVQGPGTYSPRQC